MFVQRRAVASFNIGVAFQVITSIKLNGELLLVASTQSAQDPNCPSSIQANIPQLDAYFTGTGTVLYYSILLQDDLIIQLITGHHRTCVLHKVIQSASYIACDETASRHNAAVQGIL